MDRAIAQNGSPVITVGPIPRPTTVRLATLTSGARFCFRHREQDWSCSSRRAGLHGEVVGPGPNGGIQLWEITRVENRERRRLTEWSGAVYVYPE